MDDDLLLLMLGIIIALIILTFIILGLKAMPDNALTNFISQLRFPKRPPKG